MKLGPWPANGEPRAFQKHRSESLSEIRSSSELRTSAGYRYNSRVKIGRRLVLVLLLAMTPVVAVYTYWSAQWSSRNYIADLKRETRATAHALAPVVADYIQHGQWRQVHDMLQRMSADDTDGAVLQSNGKLWYTVADLPRALLARVGRGAVAPDGIDVEVTVGERDWFCRIMPLRRGGGLIGYLLVGQDWSSIDEDVRQRMLPPVGAALLVTTLIAVLIPVLVSRYVSQPLAELSRKVLRFSRGEELTPSVQDEIELLSEEFQRLDQRLTKAHEDLLERHRYELELDRRLQRADRLATIGTLASGLAHEIGTPMAVIRTRTELLLEENAANNATREVLEIILSQIERISRIVRMLLDYARSREPARSWHDVRTIVEHVLKLVETEARQRGVHIVMRPGNEPLGVECDAGQLQQVFINLAVNAFDAMAPEGGTLSVSTEVEQKNQLTPLVKLTFEDNGSGVPPGIQEHLFDPFFTTKPPGQGTGMGLSVSQAIIHDHNGEISFDSGPGNTRFFVKLPMATANSGSAVQGYAAERAT